MLAQPTAITGRHVLIGMLAFFGLIVAVNLVFIYFALTSFTGLETDDAYRRGLAYNQTLEAAERQAERGWRVTLAEATEASDTWRLSAEFRDADGLALDKLAVTAWLRRPSHDREDRRLSLAPLGEGRYEVSVARPSSGQWRVVLHAAQRDELLYRSERRVWLKDRP